MNRRSFLRFFGKGTVIAGLAATVGLPKVEKQELVAGLELSEEVEYEFIVPGETSQDIDYWNGKGEYIFLDDYSRNILTSPWMQANFKDIIPLSLSEDGGLYMNSDRPIYLCE